MNLNKLFQIQAELDNRIVEEHNLQGVDLLDKKILALQVELGELANNWRGFKFWSRDQEARTKAYPKDICTCKDCESYWCDKVHESTAEAKGIYVNPLLEEYVDCLHFLLSIGNDFGYRVDELNSFVFMGKSVTQSFNKMFRYASAIDEELDAWDYRIYLTTFIGLGRDLGFTTDQIIQAYLDKNKINHERQEQGY